MLTWDMVRPLRSLGGTALFFFLILTSTGDAQQSAPAAPAPPAGPSSDTSGPQQPVFRAGINYVRVDVIVTDRNGNPVDDLTVNDFDVTEDGKPQKVDSFKLIKLDGGVTPTAEGPPRRIRNDADEELEAARDDVRLFGLFLDEYHVRRNASVSIRQPLTNFLQAQLGPSDMLGLMGPLDSIHAVRLTRDRDSAARAIQRFVGRRFEYDPRNDIEARYAGMPPEAIERIRNQISLSAIKAFIVRLGSLKEGRKALILVSEGFTNVLPPQLRDQSAAFPGFNNPNRNNATAGLNDPREDTRTFFANADLEDDLRQVYDAANRNNVAIYAIDPRGLTTVEFDASQPTASPRLNSQFLNATMETLRSLASQTDGRAIVNSNDFASGMKQMVRDTSAYYLLGYASTQAPTDGNFHPITVRVRRPGVQVRARRGYWAATTADVARATRTPGPAAPKAVTAAIEAVSESSRVRIIRTWIGTSRAENGRTRVTFVWEPTPDVAGERREAPARVALTAIAKDGSPVFRGRVPDMTSAPGGARAPARATFVVPPGSVQLRVSVEGASSQVLDSETREISVPDLTGPQILGTPAVLRARNARELQQLKNDPDAVPHAMREFARSERLLVRVPAYGPGDTALPVSVHLLNRSGKSMSEVPTTESGLSGIQQIDLPLAGLAPGEYVLEIKSQAGDGAKQLVAFRVTG
jgi:VWFA-related protein